MKQLPFLNCGEKTAMVAMLAVAFLASPALSADRFEQLRTKEISIPEKAVDLVVSADGNWTFVLTSLGEVAIYQRSGELIQTLQVGSGYEHIQYDGSGNRLVLAGSGKRLKFISLVMRFDINSEGSPYRGSKGAPVTIAVYSDFQ
jgi:hypothetical protein